MIYLILTTSINNRILSLNDNEKRKEQYIDAITYTLSLLPEEIQPIIVENNGKRSTYLDNFLHFNKVVPIIYTNNNEYTFKNKGINEMLDIKEVIKQYAIKDDDIIIKLTGRYRVTTPSFFEKVIHSQNKIDAFIKFFGSCSLKYETYDCILGMYAIRCVYLKLVDHNWMNLYLSPEIAFAKYIRNTIFRLDEITQLDLQCIFSEDNRILYV
jgi:hypothetical protein